jgi:hypothetical protein
MSALDFKKQADKPMRIFEELNRPVTYILDDVKETIVTKTLTKLSLTMS